MDRRSFLAGLSTVFLSESVKASEGQALSAQAQLLCDHMRARGEKSFVVMDKKRGELLVIEQGGVLMRSPALYGKGKGEDRRKDATVTPAGIFNMQECTVDPREYDGGRGYAFLQTKTSTCLIHPTWNGVPSEKRAQRLASASPEDNAISHGCINVPYEFYSKLDGYMKSKIYAQYGAGNYSPVLPKLVVLPKDDDLARTRAFFNIPPGPVADHKLTP